MNRARSSYSAERPLLQWLEDTSAATGLTRSALINMAVRKMQSDFGFFGMSTGNRPAVRSDELAGYRRRRPRRDLEETAV